MKIFIDSHIPFCLLLGIMVIMSLILFITMGADKRRAKREMYRVPEARLFLLALLGGGPGGWAGMYAIHHKTKHMKFVILFPIIAIVQLGGLLYLLIA